MQGGSVLQREVVLTGIGGQGVQLAAKTLAMAATAEGRQVMMSSHYGGEMRGGQTEASVVVSDGQLRPVPILESTWSAYVMHHRYWPGVAERLRAGGIAVVNSSVANEEITAPGVRIVPVAAGEVAVEVGSAMAAGFVLLGAFAAITGLAATDSLVEAMRQLVPPYRTQHLTVNEAALRAGAEVGAGLDPVGAPR
ncbi:MAG: 2-oxoacid:acceptor oxidoreductase family protein [Acidobacteriota bacterium]|nr:2-oxoacid:acceptor oxidoreductase family protein [Acidobacteriota bacterium]